MDDVSGVNSQNSNKAQLIAEELDKEFINNIKAEEEAEEDRRRDIINQEIIAEENKGSNIDTEA